MNCKPVQVGGEGRRRGGDGQIYFILAEAFLCSPVPSDTPLCSVTQSPPSPGGLAGSKQARKPALH